MMEDLASRIKWWVDYELELSGMKGLCYLKDRVGHLVLSLRSWVTLSKFITLSES